MKSTNVRQQLLLGLSAFALGGENGGDDQKDAFDAVGEFLRASNGDVYGNANDRMATLLKRETEAAIAIILHRVANSEQQVLRSRSAQALFRELPDRLAPEFWKRAGIDPGRVQRHELSASLAREVRHIEDRICSTFTLQPEIAGLASLQAQITKIFADSRARAVYGPFCSWPKEAETFKNVLSQARKIWDEPNLVDYERWMAVLEGLLNRLQESGYPLDSQLAILVRRLEPIVTARLDESGLRDPAELGVKAVLRRLPLAIPGQRFRLPLLVENSGRGTAEAPRLHIDIPGRVWFDQSAISLGDALEPGEMRVELDGVVGDAQSADEAMTDEECLLTLSWFDWRGEECSREQVITIHSQRADIDWPMLEQLNPYGLDPVRDPDDLFGRKQMLNQLVATFRTDEVGSAFIQGHKRVGKTSLALAALHQLNLRYAFSTVFRDAGSINHPDPSETVDALVSRWVFDIKRSVTELADIPAPRSKGALSSLCAFLEEAVINKPDLRLILALDEFDRLPGELLRRTPAGDAFFTALRSISSLHGVGLLLIGGERMKLVLSGPGVELNKFRSIQVDTIDRERHWSDFVTMIRAPVAGLIDINDDAVDAAYAWTKGNPYFAKTIMQRVYEAAVSLRHDEVSPIELEAAVAELVRPDSALSLTANSFSHYWEDYILERNEDADDVTLQRRRVLLSLAHSLRSGGSSTSDEIRASGLNFGLDPGRCAAELDQFRQRGLLDFHANGTWSARLPIFQRWLVERGSLDITMNVAELESEALLARRDSELAIDYDEAREWSLSGIAYRGAAITPDRLLSYLRQFGKGAHQRTVFDLLKRVRFVTSGDVVASCRVFHEVVVAELQSRGTWSRDRILLTALDGLGKSQQTIARDYCEAAGITLRHNLVDVQELGARLHEGRLQALVVVDDFAGTGRSLAESLSVLVDHFPDATEVPLYIFAVVGFDVARQRIVEALDALKLSKASVRFGIELTDADRALAPDAFASSDSRALTAQVLQAWGDRLEPKHPLGFGDTEALVAFDRTTPNNSVPILWKSTKEFEALFPRSRQYR